MNYTEPVIALVLFSYCLFWLNIFMPVTEPKPRTESSP